MACQLVRHTFLSIKKCKCFCASWHYYPDARVVIRHAFDEVMGDSAEQGTQSKP